MRNTFTTIVANKTVYSGDSLEAAIRAWDAETFDFEPDKLEGGITIQTTNNDVIVRDGYILHVSNGRVYLNPNLEVK